MGTTGRRCRPGETLSDTAIREVAEETGIVLEALGPCVWIRETRFHYRNRAHHCREHVFLAHPTNTTAITRT
ncbi:MAG: NUDIX domain-containing protein [Actinomycetota bacterium]|nr:NUDIX domain-containing protein [Actinomycetota bacterium]